jgi:hypothetical protein
MLLCTILLTAALGAQDPCTWRLCELEAGPLACTSPGQVCDMYRNQCVPTGASCGDVVCPAGSICAPATGRCGAPAGQGCFDMGSTWWTGRDIPPGQVSVSTGASPVTIEVHNDGDAPIYFDATWQQPLRFDILAQVCSREQRLELPENHFCPCPCPASGASRCRDCGRPPPLMQRLPPGEQITLRWSGTEEVGVRRICDKGPGELCMSGRVTLPGSYELEVCAYSTVQGGQLDAHDVNRLQQAIPAGQQICRRVAFQLPASVPVVVHFGNSPTSLLPPTSEPPSIR